MSVALNKMQDELVRLQHVRLRRLHKHHARDTPATLRGVRDITARLDKYQKRVMEQQLLERFGASDERG